MRNTIVSVFQPFDFSVIDMSCQSGEVDEENERWILSDGKKRSGENGIRTRATGFPADRISNPALSATQPSLRVGRRTIERAFPSSLVPLETFASLYCDHVGTQPRVGAVPCVPSGTFDVISSQADGFAVVWY